MENTCFKFKNIQWVLRQQGYAACLPDANIQATEDVCCGASAKNISILPQLNTCNRKLWVSFLLF
jgi:hypothetical protein